MCLTREPYSNEPSSWARPPPYKLETANFQLQIPCFCPPFSKSLQESTPNHRLFRTCVMGGRAPHLSLKLLSRTPDDTLEHAHNQAMKDLTSGRKVVEASNGRTQSAASTSQLNNTIVRDHDALDVQPSISDKDNHDQDPSEPMEVEVDEAEENISPENVGLRRSSRQRNRFQIRGQFVCPLCHEDFSRVGLLNHL